MDAISYLQGFFDGEGGAYCVTGRRAASQYIGGFSTSEELVTLVVGLLRQLGFSPHVRCREGHNTLGKRPYYCIILGGRRDIIMFARLIGFRKKENANRLRQMRRHYWRAGRRHRFTNRGGYVRKMVALHHEGLNTAEIGRRLGIAHSTVYNVLKREHGHPLPH